MRFTSVHILFLEEEHDNKGQDGESAKMQQRGYIMKHVLMIVFKYNIRPWQHNVCSPVEAPAEVSSSSFHSRFPAVNLNQNLESIKYLIHKVYDINQRM